MAMKGGKLSNFSVDLIEIKILFVTNPRSMIRFVIFQWIRSRKKFKIFQFSLIIGERFGSGEIGMGLIPDWSPIYYQWEQVQLPYYVQDTEPARRDIAAQYTTISRLDQGIGLILKELKDAGRDKDTLVVYTSGKKSLSP